MEAFVGALAALSPVLIVILAAIGWLYRHERERRENAEQQVSEHKYRAYIALVEIFFDMFKATKMGQDTDEDQLLIRMMDANKELMMYASDDVLRIYQRWLGEARTGIVDLERFGELMVAIRRDMGHPGTEITSDEILRQFITDYDKAKAQGQLRQVQNPQGD